MRRLAPGLVPYEGLCCHVRLAVEQAQAERIGHGVDIIYENSPHALLKEMAANHVMVEISLTSNDVILGVSGKDHPFSLYRMFGVPVALSTDDEGVSRIDLTHEYVRAVQTYDLRYADLKRMVRSGLETQLLARRQLVSAPDAFIRAVPACSYDSLGGEKPSSGCAAFLKSSERLSSSGARAAFPRIRIGVLTATFRRGWSFASRKLGCFEGDGSNRQTHSIRAKIALTVYASKCPTQVAGCGLMNG